MFLNINLNTISFRMIDTFDISNYFRSNLITIFKCQFVFYFSSYLVLRTSSVLLWCVLNDISESDFQQQVGLSLADSILVSRRAARDQALCFLSRDFPPSLSRRCFEPNSSGGCGIDAKRSSVVPSAGL